MRLVILTTDKIQTICDQQEQECQGINCKECQFNKIGVDTKFLKEQIYKQVLDILEDSKEIDNWIKAQKISNSLINLLLKEESDQLIIGSKIFKKSIH